MKRNDRKRYFHPSQALSPLRYPGGKSWLIPTIEKWLDSIRSDKRYRFIEPFAGGANVGLTMLENGKIAALTTVEIDMRLRAFLKLMLTDPDSLVTAIREFVPTQKNLTQCLSCKPKGYRKLGFQTLVKNRTSRGGVIAARAGMLKQGERNRGPFSRWYPETLIKRIKRIKRVRCKISLVEGDGIRFLCKRRNRKNDIYFIDPPYSFSKNGAGRRLYSHFEVPHKELLKALKQLSGRFLVTYDDDRSIEQLAKTNKLAFKGIRMRNSNYITKKELLISDDLDWLSGRTRSHRKVGKSEV